ncbi:host cell division inhibitor Icd-like protein [Salmonella enterica]|nr:host cell division inhibitor Icd-like protein [Salmonella enterica]
MLSRKATLDHLNHWRYAYHALHKTSAGIRTPKNSMATQTPKASFFVSCLRVSISGGKTRYVSMVTLAGQPQGWPVSIEAGSSNPVNVTAPIEIRTSSGDSSNSMEAAVMATVPTQSHHKFLWRFYSPRTNQRHTVIASTEAQARSRLRNPAYLFSARIRITEGVYQVRACLHLSDGEERSFLLPDLFADRQQAERLASASGFNFSFPGHTGQVICEVVEVRHD